MLILGVGNELLGDEGLGVHVARSLLDGRCSLPADVKVLEAGTALLDFVPEMSRHARVFVVDVVRTGREPGTLYRWEVVADSVRRMETLPSTSLHEWGLLETLRAAEMLGLMPKNLTLLGAEPQTIEPSMELSPRLAQVVEKLVTILLEEASSAHLSELQKS